MMKEIDAETAQVVLDMLDKTKRKDAWSWNDAMVEPASIRPLILAGLVRESEWSTRKKKRYTWTDRTKTRALVKSIINGKYGEAIRKETTVGYEMPDGTPDWGDIQGFDDLKELFEIDLRSKTRRNRTLQGPFACAKSLFLAAIAKWAGVPVWDGASLSRAGITNYLRENRPRYLIIDEIGNLTKFDQKALQVFMETGTVARMKGNDATVVTFTCTVFAAWNFDEQVLPAIISRFGSPIRFPAYTKSQFEQVGLFIAKKRGVSAATAKKAIKIAWEAGNDIRSVVQVFDCDSEADMIRTMEITSRYNKKAVL